MSRKRNRGQREQVDGPVVDAQEQTPAVEEITPVEEPAEVAAEPTPEPVVVDEPNADADVQTADEKEQAPQEAPQVEEQLSPTLQLIRQRLVRYATEMAPGRGLNANDGARHQQALYRVISDILALEGPEFLKGMEILIGFAREQRTGVFAERYVARFMDQVYLTRAERLNFERLIRLISVAASVQRRTDVGTHVDVALAVKGLRDGGAQQRLLEYFDAD